MVESIVAAGEGQSVGRRITRISPPTVVAAPPIIAPRQRRLE